MNLLSYVVRNDLGFAPNPFGGFCSLATCKPVIRRTASQGDWVIGTGSSRAVGADRLVYAMRLSEVVTLDEYSLDDRFAEKVPKWRSAWWRRLGDNIYYRGEMGRWQQRRSLHRAADMERDLSGRNALVGEEFYYFGGQAPALPEAFRSFVKRGPGHLRIKDETLIEAFASWLRSSFETGVLGEPFSDSRRKSRKGQIEDATCSIEEPDCGAEPARRDHC